MMPKTTHNLLTDFFSNPFLKIILFLPSFFKEKVGLLLSNTTNTSLLAFDSSKTFAKSILGMHEVEQNRKNKGAPPEEVYYNLYISIYWI